MSMIFILLVGKPTHALGLLHKKVSPFTLFLQAEEVKFEHELIGSIPVND